MRHSSPADLKTPTQPTDCGLAIALPLTAEEISQDIKATNHEYAKGLVNKNSGKTHEEIIKPIAEVALELVAIAESLGVDVRQSATLADLKELFQSCSVVTIVAHWCGHNLRPDDLLVPPQELASKILCDTDDIAVALRERLNTSELAKIASNDASERSTEQLVNLLNKAIASCPLKSPNVPPNIKIIIDDVSLAAANRDLLDLWAGGTLRPGNRLELRDGLHPSNTIELQIPNEFTGIIDFAICNSIILGDTIRKGYPNRRVIMNARSVQPIPRLLILKLLYQQLLTGKYNYAQLLSLIYAKLANQV